MIRGFLALLGSAALAGCSVFGIRSGYEQPPYEVIADLDGGLEIRSYGPRLAAETTVRGEDRDRAQSEAFGVLAGFIFGGNRENKEVAMTAPVEVEAASAKIAMTVPVETEAAGGELAMRFFMPARFARETLPEPVDPRVRIVEVPGETLAVVRFSGLGRSSTLAAKRTELLEALASSSWRAEAEPKALFYDPPWTLPFLRRNELAVAVSPRG